MNNLPEELWDVVVSHCVFWDGRNPDIDTVLLLHRTNKYMGRTASRLISEAFDALYEVNEDDAGYWWNECITNPLLEEFYIRIDHIFKQECAFNIKTNRQQYRESIHFYPSDPDESDEDMRSEISFDERSDCGIMTRWLKEQMNEVGDELTQELDDTFLMHSLCAKWIRLARENAPMVSVRTLIDDVDDLYSACNLSHTLCLQNRRK